MKYLQLLFNGQLKSGKNNMIVTRTGLHFPKPEWAKWRDAQVLSIKCQNPQKVKFDSVCSIDVKYWPGDLRRRDVPGMADAICHVLERSEVVDDDCLLQNWLWSYMELNRSEPKAEVIIRQEAQI